MMTEQQMTSKNDDLQDRWKLCVKVTCFAVRTSEELLHRMSILKELLDTIGDLIRAFARKVSEAFGYVKDLVAEAFNRYAEKMDYEIPSKPKCRPTYKTKVKTNPTGFSMPIIYRARSRC